MPQFLLNIAPSGFIEVQYPLAALLIFSDMKQLVQSFAIAFFFLCTSNSLSAQVDYPYNPDADGDGFIAVVDLFEFLSVFGGGFVTPELLVDSIPLGTYLEILQESLVLQAMQLDSLEALMTNVEVVQAPEQFEMLRVWDRGIEYIGQYVPSGETQQFYYPMQDSLTQRSINGWELVTQDRIEETTLYWITGGGQPSIKAYQYNLVFSRPAQQ